MQKLVNVSQIYQTKVNALYEIEAEVEAEKSADSLIIVTKRAALFGEASSENFWQSLKAKPISKK